MQDDVLASHSTVQGQDESCRCFLEGCWRWGVGFLDEGQGFLPARGTCEVCPGSSFRFPSLHNHSFRRLLLGVLHVASQFLDVRPWVSVFCCSRYWSVRFVECPVQAPCGSLVCVGRPLQYALDAVLQWIVVQVHGVLVRGDVEANGQ